MSENHTQNTHFYPVQVTVRPGAKSGTYVVSCEPDQVTITHEASVVMYQLVSAPNDVTFWSLDLEPGPANQFKAPEIGARGRMLTLGDADVEKAVAEFNVKLHLTDPQGSVFLFDPQIINRPG
jgi:hypothetical protein